MKRLTFSVLAFFFVSCATLAAQTSAGNANLDNGKKLFERYGCYQCHGYVGQGGLAGARLAQTRLTLVAFTAYVRNPRPGGMPPFRAKLIADKDLADVYAYMKTFPEPPAVKDVPLLNQ
jgi:ubiquinol-cytochrome c reductase cytochrome c subunit